MPSRFALERHRADGLVGEMEVLPHFTPGAGEADPEGAPPLPAGAQDGDFFLFVRTFGMGQSTDVFRVSPTGQLTLMASDTGMDVVGAGVSTCAPTE